MFERIKMPLVTVLTTLTVAGCSQEDNNSLSKADLPNISANASVLTNDERAQLQELLKKEAERSEREKQEKQDEQMLNNTIITSLARMSLSNFELTIRYRNNDVSDHDVESTSELVERLKNLNNSLGKADGIAVGKLSEEENKDAKTALKNLIDELEKGPVVKDKSALIELATRFREFNIPNTAETEADNDFQNKLTTPVRVLIKKLLK